MKIFEMQCRAFVLRLLFRRLLSLETLRMQPNIVLGEDL